MGTATSMATETPTATFAISTDAAVRDRADMDRADMDRADMDRADMDTPRVRGRLRGMDIRAGIAAASIAGRASSSRR